MNIEEYVPIKIPISIAIEKFSTALPPNISKEIMTSIVVNEVTSVLDKVWLIDLFKTAGKEVLSSLIPVVEDFKRALNQEDPNQEDNQGIQLIYNKLIETLKNHGLEELEVKVGDSFDSEIHEAISQIPAQNDDQKGKIIDIIEGGYKLGDQVIKFPKVVVAQ